MEGIISKKVFTYDNKRYVEIILSEHKARDLGLCAKGDHRIIADMNKWDGGPCSHFERDDIASTINRFNSMWNDENSYYPKVNCLFSIVEDLLGQPANEANTQTISKCKCPIDVLMNQGCQCGGK